MMVHIKVILFDNFEVQLGKIIIIIELGLFRKSYSLTLKIIIYHSPHHQCGFITGLNLSTLKVHISTWQRLLEISIKADGPKMV